MNKPIFNGTVQLLGWSDTHNGGAKLVLQLESSEDLEAFKTLTVKNGKMAGQLLAVAMVLQNPEPEEAAPLPNPLDAKPKGGALARLAGMWCATTAFQDWVREAYGEQWELSAVTILGGDSEELAAAVVCMMCGVTSRAELDHDDAAGGLFQHYFRTPFMERVSPS